MNTDILGKAIPVPRVLPLTKVSNGRQPRRRFSNRGTSLRPPLRQNHPAITNGTPLFPSQVRSANAAEWVLKSGEHSRKLGSYFSKGSWRGLPIFSLTLPERTTCPRACKVWKDCYGNGMQWAVRFRVDSALYAKLTLELEALAVSYPKGIAVRLHSLGDFVDIEYVQFWLDAFRALPRLHAFGFTAWPRDSEIGSLIDRESSNWERFRIRFSGDTGCRGATVTDPPAWGRTPSGMVCPAQAHRPEISCGSCAFCITSREPVVFARH
jgi:hypothetical protein